MKGISIFNFNCHEKAVSVMDVLVLAFFCKTIIQTIKNHSL